MSEMAMDTPPLLEARQLTRHYQVSQGWLKPMAALHALSGVSFTLAAGDIGGAVCGLSFRAAHLEAAA